MTTSSLSHLLLEPSSLYRWAMAKYVPGATYTDAEMLAIYREAEVAIVVRGQEYELEDGRRLTRADLAEVRKAIELYASRCGEVPAMVVNLATRVR